MARNVLTVKLNVKHVIIARMNTLGPRVCDYLKIRIVDKLTARGIYSGISNIVLVLH